MCKDSFKVCDKGRLFSTVNVCASEEVSQWATFIMYIDKLVKEQVSKYLI